MPFDPAHGKPFDSTHGKLNPAVVPLTSKGYLGNILLSRERNDLATACCKQRLSLLFVLKLLSFSLNEDLELLKWLKK